MNLINNDIYINDLEEIGNLPYNWSKLQNKNLLITGATGMIGSFLIDLIMMKNVKENLNCKIYALGRSAQKAKLRFPDYFENLYFEFIEQDINEAINISADIIDYIIHAASNTHPKAYATDPIGTITTNVIATKNLLDLACNLHSNRFVFLSSVEIYGENRGDVEKFNEEYCGYIDCNTLRAGYPESKRVGEALCQAYIKQNGLDVVIPRLSRVYGPTMLLNDSKALSQFILKAVHDEDIVLKSEGNQFYSYSYVADTVSAILKIMLDGECGNVYNVSNEESDITLKELSNIIAGSVGRKVVFELPDEVEKAGFSTATKAILDVTKLYEIGWVPKYSIKKGIEQTIEILKGNL